VRGEVVVERRRQWSPEHKAALLAEIEAEGARFRWLTAGRVSTSLLYNWRSAWNTRAGY
jgi:transposase-like protein